MPVPQNTIYTPAVRVPKKHRSDELDEYLMKKGREMYARYSSPPKRWPAQKERIERIKDINYGLRLIEREKRRITRAYALQRMNFKIRDTPWPIPFRGHIIKKALVSFKIWRQKREYLKVEKWMFKEKNHEQVRHHSLLRFLQLVKRCGGLF